MKKLNFFLMMLALMAAISVGCGNNDEDPVEPTTTGPTFSLETGTSPSLGVDFITDSATVFRGKPFAVKLSVNQGTGGSITSIEVTEEGSPVDPSRIIFDGDSAQSNPNPVGNASSLDWEVIITAPEEIGMFSYEILITDSSDNDASVNFSVTTQAAVALQAGVSPTLGTQFVTDTDSLLRGESFAVQLSAAQGSGPYSTIEVRENGAAINASRLLVNSIAAPANPYSVTNSSALDWELVIESSNQPGANDYEIILTDDDGVASTVSVSITGLSTLNQSTMVMQMLSNQAGPAGQGALDIDTGEETGVTTGNFTEADIRDMGIDLSQPDASNWRQRINSINNTKLVAAATDANFDDILTMEDIMVGFNNGTEITDPDGSDVVAVGDIFFLESTDGVFYVLRVAEVNVEPTDNSDNYVFDVKGP